MTHRFKCNPTLKKKHTQHGTHQGERQTAKKTAKKPWKTTVCGLGCLGSSGNTMVKPTSISTGGHPTVICFHGRPQIDNLVESCIILWPCGLCLCVNCACCMGKEMSIHSLEGSRHLFFRRFSVNSPCEFSMPHSSLPFVFGQRTPSERFLSPGLTWFRNPQLDELRLD